MSQRLRLSDFVEKEIQYFCKECNFLPEELEYFKLRSKGKSNIAISLEMNVSERTVCRISKSVNNKIIKVIK